MIPRLRGLSLWGLIARSWSLLGRGVWWRGMGLGCWFPVGVHSPGLFCCLVVVPWHLHCSKEHQVLSPYSRIRWRKLWWCSDHRDQALRTPIRLSTSDILFWWSQLQSSPFLVIDQQCRLVHWHWREFWQALFRHLLLTLLRWRPEGCQWKFSGNSEGIVTFPVWSGMVFSVSVAFEVLIPIVDDWKYKENK